MMKEIGGYFELDPGLGQSSLPTGALFNSGRNALRHIVRSLGIRTIHVPDYTCSVVYDALRAEGIDMIIYAVGQDMLPAVPFDKRDFVLYTNYFGCCGANVDKLVVLYPNLIVDCAQAYFVTPKGRASFSSCRKFFGVSDGGVAYGCEEGDYDIDDSSSRQEHLHIRLAESASSGYAKYREAEDSLDDAPIKLMSELTRNAVAKFDLEFAAQKRRANFAYLHNRLHSTFPFAMSEDDVPMVYPYITGDPSLRARLIENKIFVAKYWPGLTSAADELANRIIPLPIDQRYGEEDMQRIVEVVNG